MKTQFTEQVSKSVTVIRSLISYGKFRLGTSIAADEFHMSKLLCQSSVALLIGFLLSPAALASGGSEGGGSGHASKFFDIARNGTSKLKMICTADAQKPECQYLEPLTTALLEVSVTADDVVLGPDGKPRDAGNDGKNAIIVSKSAWDQTQNTPDSAERWVRTALHEIAVLKNLERNDTYTASSPIINLLKNEGFDLARIAGRLGAMLPENPAVGIHFKNAHQNSDGTITFTGVTFDYGGKANPIHPGWGNNGGSRGGAAVCKQFGMSLHAFKHTYRPKKSDIVYLDSNGLVSSVSEWSERDRDLAADPESVLTSVTCIRKRQQAVNTHQTQTVLHLAQALGSLKHVGSQPQGSSNPSVSVDLKKTVDRYVPGLQAGLALLANAAL